MYRYKDTWMDRGGRLEQILRFLVLFGFCSPTAWFTSFPERQIFLDWLRSAINCCCVALERIDLIHVGWFRLQECALYVGLFERCPRPIYLATLTSLIRWSTNGDVHAEMVLGYMMLFDEQRFGRTLAELKTHSMMNNDTKFQSWVDVATVKKGTGRWATFGCNLVENFFKFCSEMAEIHCYAYLASRYGHSQQNCDLIVASIVHAPSLSCVSSGLRSLSEFCELNGEYHLALKALKNARKICFMKNGEHIAPSFVKRECTEMKRNLEAKMKGMRCGYCARIGNSDLRPCTGCMKLAYCDKRCQKKHWNREHQDSCARTWRVYYQNPQSCLRRVFGLNS